ncbi:MAG: hypothetical protein ACOYN3_03415 [Acidimicrobiia bacterium]
MTLNAREWIGYEPVLRDTALPLQHMVDATVRAQGGYWRAGSAVMRLLEECGEVADAANHCDFTEECADIIIVSTCIANQLDVSLADGYVAIGLHENLEVAQQRDLDHGFAALVSAAGHVARGVNATIGDKPLRPGHPPINLAVVIAQLHQCAAALAPSRTPPIHSVIRTKLATAKVRDSGRFTPLTR